MSNTQHQGEVVITWNEDRTQIVAVTRQDEEGRILSVLAEAPVDGHGPVPLGPEVQGLLDDLMSHLEDDEGLPDLRPFNTCFERLKNILSIAEGSEDDLAEAKADLAKIFFECARYERPSTQWIQALDDFCQALLIRGELSTLSEAEVISCLPVSPLSKKPQVWLTQKDAIAAIHKSMQLLQQKKAA